MDDPGPHRRVARFFVLAFGFTWTFQLPAALAAAGVIGGPVERYMGLMGLGLFGPIAAAMFLARGEPGGLRGLFGRARDWKVAPGWYLLAILLPGALMTAGLVVYRLAGGADLGRWTWIPNEAPRIVALFLIPVTEEVGWRGYAQPGLQARSGPLRASVVVGVLWALWHVPMFVIQGVAPGDFALSIAYFVAGSITFTWLGLRTGAMLPMAIASHFGAHLDSSMASMPGTSVPFHAQVGGYVVLAAVLVVLDRAGWRRVPSTAEAPTPG